MVVTDYTLYVSLLQTVIYADSQRGRELYRRMGRSGLQHIKSRHDDADKYIYQTDANLLTPTTFFCPPYIVALVCVCECYVGRRWAIQYTTKVDVVAMETKSRRAVG